MLYFLLLILLLRTHYFHSRIMLFITFIKYCYLSLYAFIYFMPLGASYLL